MRTRAQDLSSQGKSEDVLFIPGSPQSLPLGLKVHFGVSASPPPPPRGLIPSLQCAPGLRDSEGPRTHAYGAVVFTAASGGQKDTSTFATKRPNCKEPAGVKRRRCNRFLHLPKKPFFFLDCGVLFPFISSSQTLLSKLYFQGLNI